MGPVFFCPAADIAIKQSYRVATICDILYDPYQGRTIPNLSWGWMHWAGSGRGTDYFRQSKRKTSVCKSDLLSDVALT